MKNWKIKLFFNRISWKITRSLFKIIPFVVKCETCNKYFIISYLERDFDKHLEKYDRCNAIYLCKKHRIELKNK